MDWKKFAEAYNNILGLSHRYRSKLKSTDSLILQNSLSVFGEIYSDFLEWSSIQKAEGLETDFREALLRDQVSRLNLLLRRKGVDKREIQRNLYADLWLLIKMDKSNYSQESNAICFSPPYEPNSLFALLEKGAIESEELNKFLEEWLRLNYWVEQQLRKQVQNWIQYESK